jgi:uncharacterized membrane protein YdbT with pleckstrin-like domain
MPSYIQQTLLIKEKLFFLTRPHWVIFLLPLILFLLAWSLPDYPHYVLVLSRLILLFAFIRAIQALIMYYTYEYGITNKRVLIKAGWIRRSSFEIYLNRIESIKVNQSMMGRLLNYGSIRVIGMGGSSDEFPFIPSPIQFRHAIQEAISERLTMNTHQS